MILIFLGLISNFAKKIMPQKISFFIPFVLIFLLVSCSGKPGIKSPRGYQDYEGVVYYSFGYPNKPFVIEGADAATFKSLDTVNAYAKDKLHVYFAGKVIKHADPNSFEFLEKPYYTRDKDNVYLSGSYFCGDSKNFKFLGKYYCMNTQEVFRPIGTGDLVSEDAPHFRILKEDVGYDYAVDSKFAYVNGIKVKGAHPNLFSVIGDGFTKDNAHVFFETEEIPVSNSRFFKVLVGDYSTDGKNVFYRNSWLKDLGLEKLKVLNLDKACICDDKHAYVGNVLIKEPNLQPARDGKAAVDCTEEFIVYE